MPAGESRPMVVAGALAACLLVGTGAFVAPRAPAVSGPQISGIVGTRLPEATESSAWVGLSFGAVLGAAVAVSAAGRRVATRALGSNTTEETSRRALLMPAALLAAAASMEPANAQVSGGPSNPVPVVDLPDRITQDPYELIGMENPSNEKEDYKVFYMKRKYRDDTYQVLKHMKISASLDKGTPNMEKWNMRVKEEMNDWLALYRRQDAIVGRQSYYSLFSAVNTLASHLTSYGPKYPFPNKRRPRFFELTNTTEKYLEKGK